MSLKGSERSISNKESCSDEDENEKSVNYLEMAANILIKQEEKIYEVESLMETERKIRMAYSEELRKANQKIEYLENTTNITKQKHKNLGTFINNLGKSLPESVKRKYDIENEKYYKQEMEKIKRGQY